MIDPDWLQADHERVMRRAQDLAARDSTRRAVGTRGSHLAVDAFCRGVVERGRDLRRHIIISLRTSAYGRAVRIGRDGFQ